jgi:uncharacterized protein YcbK (DUF882 family)
MKFFKRKEFACECGCGFDTVDFELAEVVDDVRGHFGKSCHINSGCRCETHNEKVGGEEHSLHLVGQAADVRVSGIEPKDVYAYLDGKYPDRYGVGLYFGRTHIDVREVKARWDKS